MELTKKKKRKKEILPSFLLNDKIIQQKIVFFPFLCRKKKFNVHKKKENLVS